MMGYWENDIEDFCMVCQKDTYQNAWNDNDDTGTHITCLRCGFEQHELVHNEIGDVIVLDNKPYRIVKQNNRIELIHYDVVVDDDYEDPPEVER